MDADSLICKENDMGSEFSIIAFIIAFITALLTGDFLTLLTLLGLGGL